ncbi:MAG: phosphotransferase [Pseudomonadales bacterium]|nr:phosphotransferase [Pseudomonadales bacterium]
MPIDEGINVDLQFLLLEVRKQARASLSVIDKPSARKIQRIRAREFYVDTLKNTLVNKSYFNIHNQSPHERQVNYYKSVITIAANLERCADFFENIADQMQYTNEPQAYQAFELKKFYAAIYKALDATYPALTSLDIDQAQTICDIEQLLDDYYDEAYQQIRKNLKRRYHVDDMLTLLAIVGYLERIGDCFLNIGEAILDIHVGEKMGIRQFRDLQKGLEAYQIDIRSMELEFRPIMNTRSGCRVARITQQQNETAPTHLFYKEGESEKVDQEVKGLNLWQKVYPGRTPKVLWHSSSGDNSTLLLEYLEGHDLLDILISKPGQIDAALELLTREIPATWLANKRDKPAKVDFVGQLTNRRADIQLVHENLFTENGELDSLLGSARKLQRQLSCPFSTLIHGDFNVDNIILSVNNDCLHYVDMHRTHYGDYALDVAVFLVSNYRVPVFSRDIQQRLNDANLRVFECAREFARKQKDRQFEARLALGVFRSLITSTRFLFDNSVSTQMYEQAKNLLRELIGKEEKLERFRLSADYFMRTSSEMAVRGSATPQTSNVR